MKQSLMLLVIMLASPAAFAGEIVEFKCENSSCGFSGTVDCGGGRAIETNSGFCVKCQKFVSVSRKRSETSFADLNTVWIPDLGFGGIFHCPKCSSSVFDVFVDRHEAKNLFCPKCGKRTLQHSTTRIHD